MHFTLLGVDGGGTRTRAVLIQATQTSATSAPRLREIGRGESGSCNHYSVGWDAALHALASAASQALGEAQAQSSGPSSDAIPHDLSDARLLWGLGIAGAVSPVECAEWKKRLHEHLGLLPHARVEVGDDALAAQSGAFAGGEGAILIAGTGAAAFARDAHGRTARADGLGPLLADRGSGYRIGEAALRAAALHHDLHHDLHLSAADSASDAASGATGASGAILHRLVLEHFGVSSVEALVPIVYASGWAKDRAAALAPVAARAAEYGDSVARAILERAGTELAHTARAVMHPLDLSEVALFGGVLEKIPPVRQSFGSTLSEIMPSARAVEPQYDAAVGAALLALKPDG